jgi:glycine/D-amino acid oxidase-like deaminating enzyme
VIAVVADSGDGLPEVAERQGVVDVRCHVGRVRVDVIAGHGRKARRRRVQRVDERYRAKEVVRIAGNVARRVLRVVGIPAELKPDDHLVTDCARLEFTDDIRLVIEG